MRNTERHEAETTSPLQAYLEKHGLSQEEFAKKFEPAVTQGLVWQWLVWLKDPDDKRGTRITAERAIEIEMLTGGEITRGQLRSDLYPEARAA